MQVIHHNHPDVKQIALEKPIALFTIVHDEYRMTCYKNTDGSYSYPIFTDGYAMHTRQNQKRLKR